MKNHRPTCTIIIRLCHTLNADIAAIRPRPASIGSESGGIGKTAIADIADWQAIDWHAAGYAILNVELRGHGESGGSRDWDVAIADVADWIDWLNTEGQLYEKALAIMGASIGANVAIVSCAESQICQGAIALSPGLDYRGVKPESALVDGLADRSALLVASHQDSSSATAIRHMFLNAQGAVTARMVRGRAHGTRLFDSDYHSISGLISFWLEQLFHSDES